MAEYAVSIKKPTIWDIKKLNLRGVPWDKENTSRAPTMKFTITEALNPRYNVYFNDKDGDGETATGIGLDLKIVYQLLTLIEYIANNKESDRKTFVNRSGFINGRKVETPEITSRLSVGRDSDGIIYISVLVKDKPPAVFQFLPSFWAELHDASGEILDRAISSTIAALAYVKMMRDFIGPYAVIEARNVPPSLPTIKPINAVPGSKPTWNNFDDDIKF